jgi:Asp-tRNA(Asn)/Glu-tRNA(Gln) amidotransferase B subunit
VLDPTPAQLDGVEVVIDLGLEAFVNAAIDAGADPALAIARAANELAAGIDDLHNLTLESFSATVRMEQSGELSSTQAKTVLGELLASGGDPKAIATLIEENPDEWARYREGDEKLAQFFIGQVMKVTKGRANGKAVIAELQARR